VAARRTRVLARMATSRSALRAKNQAKVDSEAPSSAQLRTAVDAQFACVSSNHFPRVTERTDCRRGARWLCDSRSAAFDHCRDDPVTARVNRSGGARYGYALGARSVSKDFFQRSRRTLKQALGRSTWWIPGRLLKPENGMNRARSCDLKSRLADNEQH
jgi:hypothetical protein